MSSPELDWESLLHSDAPPGCSLKAALLTTYDRADERLLVEHLLPLLLKLNREPASEGLERSQFLMELDGRLKQLHDRLVVVSSTLREEASDGDRNESAEYPWIWRSIRHLTVGSRGKAVQHAKLWMLHWGAADGSAEYLEMVVSSANLTLNAFKGQVQAAWRVCIALDPQPSQERLKGWGILSTFLHELALSAGNEGALSPFMKLLERAECPSGVTFVASVPGTHSRQTLQRTPWGAAGLRQITPAGRGKVGVSILSPYVGAWNAVTLNRWCSVFEGAADRLSLVWIDKSHPWARDARWLLPRLTLQALTEAGATLRHLRYTPDAAKRADPFHKEHRQADDRWSHSKVYAFQRGNSRRLLMTSANFSMAAWGSEGGNAELTIENFELGVCVDQAVWPFEKLQAFEDANDAATIEGTPARTSALISWASAEQRFSLIDLPILRLVQATTFLVHIVLKLLTLQDIYCRDLMFPVF